jgi:nitrite reductase/ring-hydroxylating ferredoxin subunit
MPTNHALRRCLAIASLTTGLAIGLAATAGATPEDDFWECVGDHQDTDGIGVCCAFYGGTYDEKTGECWDYPEAAEATEGTPSPKGPTVVRPGVIDSGQVLQPATTTPVLTPGPRTPLVSVG